MATSKQIDAAMDAWSAVDEAGGSIEECWRAAIDAAEAAAWNDNMDEAPKGEPGWYATGPDILGRANGDGWSAVQIVKWHYHANGKTGAWKNQHGVWTPDEWRHLPSPPAKKEEPR